MHGVQLAPFTEDQQSLTRKSLEHEQILSGQFWGELRVFLAVAKAKSFQSSDGDSQYQSADGQPAGETATGPDGVEALCANATGRNIDPARTGACERVGEIGPRSIFPYQRLAS